MALQTLCSFWKNFCERRLCSW